MYFVVQADLTHEACFGFSMQIELLPQLHDAGGRRCNASPSKKIPE
jgi:hypothetical protein